MDSILKRNLKSEFWFHSSRSQGKGGQHVNKTASKVEVFFNVAESKLLDEDQKKTIAKKLAAKISLEGHLRVMSQATRSAYKNKEIAIDRMYILLENALKKKKVRIATGPSHSSYEKRLKEKHLHGQIKKLRNKSQFED